MTIAQWLRIAKQQLQQAGISSAQLDSELLLAHAMQVNRTYLHAHTDEDFFVGFLPILAAQLQLRTERVPIAYILGYKEFYGRTFTVTPRVLVPRPESEVIIETLLQYEQKTNPYQQPKTAIDIGTGSGILGITAALELPYLHVTLSDISADALAVAKTNANKLQAPVVIAQPANLLDNTSTAYDYIIANLPYVDKDWSDTSPELIHEPAEALYADNNGLALIYQLLSQAPAVLAPQGTLLLEADPTQFSAIIEHAARYDLKPHQQNDYCLTLRHYPES